MDNQRLKYLFLLYFNKTANQVEQEELFKYLATASDEELSSLLKMVYDDENNENSALLPNKRDETLRLVFSKKMSIQHEIKEAPKSKHPHFKQYMAIAALLLLSISIGIFFYHAYFSRSKEHGSLVQQIVEPGGNKAVLILANGKTIDLENASKGQIANQEGVIVTKTNDGQLIYKLPNLDLTKDLPIVYNTIKTPRGGQFQIVLPDGSKVWLNAESSLTYPTTFSGGRRVMLRGEGYFEIAKDESSPFVVSTNKQNVTVLGTKFNINSYRENDVIKTTLLEGSIRINNTTNSKKIISSILKPGEESSVNGQNDIIIRKVNASNSIAWKNGLFNFEGTDIVQVMQEYSRWYNIPVEFDGTVPNIKLWGSVYRNVSASEALEILGYFNLHYQIINDGKNKKIVISKDKNI